MAATEALLTWNGLPPRTWNVKEEESMATMQTRLQAMTIAMRAKDAALEDLQRRLNAALEDLEWAQTREAALKRRAEKAEEAEEALASQMAELEAEAFTRITQADRRLASRVEEDHRNSQLSGQVAELERRLQAAEDKAAAMSQRCEVLEEELAQARIREAAFQRRAEKAEEAEEALAAQMAELEAESFTRITEANKMLAKERSTSHGDSIANSQVAELERRLAEAGEELVVANAKLRFAQDKNRLTQGEFRVLKEGERASEETVMSLSLEDLAGFVKLKLWNPSSLALPIGSTVPC